jgi:hypothetical protein
MTTTLKNTVAMRKSGFEKWAKVIFNEFIESSSERPKIANDQLCHENDTDWTRDEFRWVLSK